MLRSHTKENCKNVNFGAVQTLVDHVDIEKMLQNQYQYEF